MVKYMVVSRTIFMAKPNAYIMKHKRYAKCTMLSRSVEGIQAARKIGYRAKGVSANGSFNKMLYRLT